MLIRLRDQMDLDQFLEGNDNVLYFLLPVSICMKS